jgi:hypothetical protein
MLHPDTEVRHVSDAIGLGVFAVRPIPRGTLMWVVCERERIHTAAAVAAMPEAERDDVERRGYIDASGVHVVCCDAGRYVNHDCAAATLPLGPEVEIAVRDLAAGDEITCEYSTLNLTFPLHCRCGRPDCRGVVRGDDVLRPDLWPGWDRLVVEAVAQARHVAQPLLPFAVSRADLRAIIDGTVPVPSVRICFHPGAEPPVTVRAASTPAARWHLPRPG